MIRRRIVFMGSPDFAVPALDALSQEHEILAVYTQPPRKSGRGMTEQMVPVARHARDQGLTVRWPASLADKAVQDELAVLAADLFVVVAYGLLLPKQVLELPVLGCINGHASLLPRWRGAAPIQRAIAAGDKMTGMSVMLMEEGLDTGAVLAQRTCAISGTDTAGSLHDSLATLNATLLRDVVTDIERLLPAAQEQSEADAIYAAKISPHEAAVDWRLPAVTLDRHIRAFSPFPGAWFTGPKGRIKITAAYVDATADAASAAPGTFVGRGEDGTMRIMTGDGVLALLSVQPAGKKPMTAVAFLNGQDIPIGSHFASPD